MEQPPANDAGATETNHNRTPSGGLGYAEQAEEKRRRQEVILEYDIERAGRRNY